MAEKNRKSEEQKRFDAADNAGRFAGNDPDATAARNQAIENIRQDTTSGNEERSMQNEGSTNDQSRNTDNQMYSDAEARRDPGQAHDYKEEAQNVNDDTGRPLSEEEAEKARNKATEGLKQGRQETGDSAF